MYITLSCCYIPNILDAITCFFLSTGGEYLIPLHGHCLDPKPQGPFEIRAGTNITIPFKNVTNQAKSFFFSVDNPAFAVKATEIIKARKSYNVTVYFDAKHAEVGVAKVGKLMVTDTKSGKPGTAQWVFYLKGVSSDKSLSSV